MATLAKQLNIDAPLSLDKIDEYRIKWTEALGRWATEARAKNEGILVGEIVRWQIADGYAQYMVMSQKPLKLAHINEGDGYAVDSALIRGLRLVDVMGMINREHALKALFEKGKK